MGKLSEDAKQEIRLAMAGLSGADARQEARELSESLGVNEGTIYRYSAKCRGSKARTNRGERKLPLDDNVLEKMKAFTYQTDCPAPDVIEIFEKNGELKPGVISPSWFTRWLKAQAMSRKEMKQDRRPCRRFEASEPGELFQIDHTPAEQFYIDDDGSVAWESTVSRNKNRAGNRKKRLIIFGAIDDYSRCTYAEFTTGQTVNHWLNFLFNTFMQKKDPRFYFHGIPRSIYMDNDTVAKSPKFVKAMSALGVRVRKHKPTLKTDRFSNARSKGKIERFLQFLAEKQKRTKLKKFTSLEEANQFLMEVCLQYNNKIHSTTGETPLSRWIRIRPEMLIQCEDRKIYELLYRDEFQCKVYNDLTLRLDGEIWQLEYCEPFFQMIGQRVIVFRHPLKQDKIYVEWEGREYQVSRRVFEPRAWAEGPAHLPKSEREQQIEEMENMDFGHLKLWGFDKGPNENAIFLPSKKGVDSKALREKIEPPKVKQFDAMYRISRELGRNLSEQENKFLTGLFGEWVTDEEIERAIEQLTRQANLEVKSG